MRTMKEKYEFGINRGVKLNFHMAQDLKGLIRSLNSRDNEERAEAAKSISLLAKKGTSDVDSIKPLISCLFDSNRFVRHNSAFAIGDLAEFCGIFDSSAVSPLQRLLSIRDDVQCFAGLLLDSNQRVRYNAAYAIGYLAEFGAFDKSTIYPLIGLLSDRDGIVRGSAAFALGCQTLAQAKEHARTAKRWLKLAKNFAMSAERN